MIYEEHMKWRALSISAHDRSRRAWYTSAKLCDRPVFANFSTRKLRYNAWKVYIKGGGGRGCSRNVCSVELDRFALSEKVCARRAELFRVKVIRGDLRDCALCVAGMEKFINFVLGDRLGGNYCVEEGNFVSIMGLWFKFEILWEKISVKLLYGC